MTRFFVELDDADAEWLAASVDDAHPTLRDVAQAILTKASKGRQQEFGYLPCRCGALERLSLEEDTPIIFDPLLNEYQITLNTAQGLAKHRIYFCMSCGGKAPSSRRDQLFAKVENPMPIGMMAWLEPQRTTQGPKNISHTE